MRSYWAEWAWLPDGVQPGVRLEIGDGRFGAVVAAPREPGDERLDGIVLPGFANAHSHAFHRVLRGRTHGDGGTFWTWRQQMYAIADRLDPDRYLALARAVYAEMVLAGMTATGEFHYLHHDRGGRRYADPNAMSDALAIAAEEAGIRLTLLDACYLSGGLGERGHEPLDPVQRRFADGSAAEWADRVAAWTPPAGVVKGAAIHSVRAVPAGELGCVALAAAGPLHVHVSEQRAENAATLAFYGCTPVELLDRHGVLGDRTTVVHATHLSASDIERLGTSRTYTCFCPTTERDLADGIGPALALASAGSRLCLGSDQHAMIDMFAEMRGLEMHERLLSGQRGRFTPEKLIKAAAGTGHASLGRPDAGRLVSGAPADFVVVDGGSVRTVGSRPDQIAYAATAADVHRVVVAGETIVRDGEHRLGSVPRLLADAVAGLETQS